MDGTIEKFTQQLLEKNIKPSYARIKVLEYIMHKKNHPTVDEIYSELVKEIPTLSRTTVYNTLNLFAKENLVRTVTIEDNEMRYDGTLCDHGHFKCEECGKVYDFSIDIDRMLTQSLGDFKINEKNVYFKGICPCCSENKLC